MHNDQESQEAALGNDRQTIQSLPRTHARYSDGDGAPPAAGHSLLRMDSSEAWYRSIFHSAPDGLLVIDENGVITHVNLELCRMFGYEKNNLIGQPIELLVAPDARSTHAGQRGRFVAARGTRHAYEIQNLRGCRRDGSLFDVDISLSTLADGMSICAAVRDITLKKQMESQLAQALANEERRIELQFQLQAISDNLPGAITYFRTHPDGHSRMLFASPALNELVGLSLEDLAEDIAPMARRIHPDDLSRVAMAMDDATRKFSTYSTEFRVIHPDRGELWVHHVSSPLKETDGSILWFGMMFDITEKRRAEAALIEKEREFRTLVENSPDAIARFGTDLCRLYANPAAARFLDASPDTLLGVRPTSIPGGKTGALVEARLADVIANGEACSFEYSIPKNDGTEIRCLATFSPEVGDDGRVLSVLAASRDITELSESRMKIHQMAFYDALTHLPNRALFNDRLHQLVVDAARHCQLAAVMMIDLDRFKTINDTFGHAAGDQLLREAAARLVACVRAYDTVARLGGDEFAILLPEVRASADIGRVATKILAGLDAPFQLDGKEVFVSCSIGIAMFPEDTKHPPELLSYADSAMYVAKRAGRNGFRFYSPEITAKARERLTLEAELRHALARRQMQVFYQPKVALATGEIVGSEALLRWRHPEFGMVPPDRFIPVAEDTGIILDIGRWVMLKACRQATLWNEPGKPLHKVAINVSARQFQARNMAKLVACTLSETACRPEWIELEITESLLLDEDGTTYDAMRAIRSMGVTIAIDDFGTGYSALSYLARFPIDVLKIDRSFIQSAVTESYRGELVLAILSIARCLGQQVVAEGIETLDQAAFLDAHGCQMAQGYLYSKPVPPEEFNRLPRRFSPKSTG